MTTQDNLETVKNAWDHLGRGDLDALAALYAEDMLFVLPGQGDELRGRDSFRKALDSIGEALPPGFDIKDLRYSVGDSEVMNVVEWTSKALPGGTQSAILWKFDGEGQIKEERWFVDTEQWKEAF